MKMDELRRQLATTAWPVVLRIDGKDILVKSREDLMVPTAGGLICVYEDGAFEVIDSDHVATLHRTKTGRRPGSSSCMARLPVREIPCVRGPIAERVC